MVYAGKWSGWYAVSEMMDFVAVARNHLPNLRLLVLTQEPQDRCRHAAKERNIDDILTVRAAARESMVDYLSAADVGLSFRLPLPSASACSPVKNGEYLACGLPIVALDGVGDYSRLIATREVGVLLKRLDAAEYQRGALELRNLMNDSLLNERCREVAKSEVGLLEVVVPRYRAIYEEILGVPRNLAP